MGLGSPVLLSEEQRALPENVTFHWGSRDDTSSEEAVRSCSTECVYRVTFRDIRSHPEVLVKVLSVLSSCQSRLQSCVSKWC